MSYDCTYDDDLEYDDTWNRPYDKRHPDWIPPPRDPILRVRHERDLDRLYPDRRRDVPPPQHRYASSSRRRYASPPRRRYTSPSRRHVNDYHDSMPRRAPIPQRQQFRSPVPVRSPPPMYSDEDIAELKAKLKRLEEIKTEFDWLEKMRRTKEARDIVSAPAVRSPTSVRAAVDRAPSSNIEVAPKPDLETGTFQSQGKENDVTPPSPAESEPSRDEETAVMRSPAEESLAQLKCALARLEMPREARSSRD